MFCLFEKEKYLKSEILKLDLLTKTISADIAIIFNL